MSIISSNIKCLFPLKVKNKYTDEYMVVSCGKCAGCRASKSASATLKCQLESLSHKYNFFITLTYDPKYIPLMKAINVHGSHGTRFIFVSDCERLDYEGGLILNEVDYTHRELNDLREKCKIGDLFPYCSSRDAQLFLKRFRKNISKISNERIRYYLVCELGPKSLRPHFHLQLWCSDEAISTRMAELVNKSWQFGFTDIQKVTSSASSYVAGYINSLGSLPRLYQSGKCKPFSRHSFFLGEEFFKSKKKEAYSLTAREFMHRSIKNTIVDADFLMWRNVTNYFYPRCRRYTTSSPSERKLLYTSFQGFLGKYKPSEVARMIMIALNDNVIFEDFCTLDKGLYTVVSFLAHLYNDEFHIRNIFDVYYHDPNPKYFVIDKTLQGIYNTICNDLRLSRHFLTFVCDSLNPLEVHLKLKMIDNFYKDVELMRLNDLLAQQVEFVKDNDVDDLQYFYIHSDLNQYKHTKAYKVMRTSVLWNADNRMKHKRQNDANRIWFKERNL